MSRLGILIFFITLVSGFWFQRRFMKLSSDEFQAEINADRSQSDLLKMNQFVAFHYQAGTLRSTVKASEGRLVKSGDLLLDGNVKYQDYQDDLVPRVSLSARKAICKLAVENPNQNFFDTARRFESVFLPDEVLIVMQEDLVTTKDVTLNMNTRRLETQAPIAVVGPGRNVDGKGLVYNIDTEEFQLGGLVKGQYVPQNISKQQ